MNANHCEPDIRRANYKTRHSDRLLEAAGHPAARGTVDDLIAAFDVHVGTPTDVIASLRADSTLVRATDLAVQVHSIDPPHRDILRSIELVAEFVAPAFGWQPGSRHDMRRVA